MSSASVDLSATVAVIGGSGLYRMEALQDVAWHTVNTPFGTPSDALCYGTLCGHPVLFLPRHGRTHHLSPATVNYRANIHALAQLGVRKVVAISTVRSLSDKILPGDFVLVDQFIDRTTRRERSFFQEGVVAHVSMQDPVCPRMCAAVSQAAAMQSLQLHTHTTYIAIEGPTFGTRAEARMHAGWGADVVGMTNVPEAYLAREAEMCYTTIGMVSDHEPWHASVASARSNAVVSIMERNTSHAQRLLEGLIPMLSLEPNPCPAGCQRALDHAVVTPRAARDAVAVQRLWDVARRIL